jgi:hypothetical protein
MTFPGAVFSFEVRAQVGVPLELGDLPAGRRRIVPILGGTFEGPEIKGRVLSVGADWQIVRPDGVFELDARYTLETDAGKLIYVVNRGMRHGPPEEPAKVYFRSVPLFETAVPELQWLTRSIFVGSGERYPSDVVIRFWRIE